jgi:hypothetical protein
LKLAATGRATTRTGVMGDKSIGLFALSSCPLWGGCNPLLGCWTSPVYLRGEAFTCVTPDLGDVMRPR